MTLFAQSWPRGLPIGTDWVVVREEPVLFPFTGEQVALAPVGDAALATAAIDSALAIRTEMSQLSSRVRREWLRETHGALVARREDFEQLLVLETGKPLRDCVSDDRRTSETYNSYSWVDGESLTYTRVAGDYLNPGNWCANSCRNFAQEMNKPKSRQRCGRCGFHDDRASRSDRRTNLMHRQQQRIVEPGDPDYNSNWLALPKTNHPIAARQKIERHCIAV